MIPTFNDDGYLPPGIHVALLDEIDERFGQSSEIRRAQMESLRWLVEAAKRAGVLRMVINGSFVTDSLEPNDVDCALLVGEQSPETAEIEAELMAVFPFVEFQIVRNEGFQFLVEELFASDRVECPKGVVEVRLC